MKSFSSSDIYVGSYPYDPKMIYSNVINDKCSFGIDEPEKCPVIMVDNPLNKKEDKKK